MLTVSDLVHSSFLGSVELPIFIHCILFQKEADLVSRRQEVLVANVVVIARREFRLRDDNQSLNSKIMAGNAD